MGRKRLLRAANDEVAVVADRIAGLRLERGYAYGVHRGLDGVYRANETPFRGDPVGALALNQYGGIYVAETAQGVLARLLGRKIGRGFCPGISAGFVERRPVSEAADYMEGYAIGRALWVDGGGRALMRERAIARLEAKRTAARVAFFGYGHT